MSKKTKGEQLDEILVKMRGQQSNGNTEVAHLEADKLLCDALTLLGQAELVEAYTGIGRWYA